MTSFLNIARTSSLAFLALAGGRVSALSDPIESRVDEHRDRNIKHLIERGFLLPRGAFPIFEIQDMPQDSDRNLRGKKGPEEGKVEVKKHTTKTPTEKREEAAKKVVVAKKTAEHGHTKKAEGKKTHAKTPAPTKHDAHQGRAKGHAPRVHHQHYPSESEESSESEEEM